MIKELEKKLQKWLDENPDAPKEKIKKAKEALKKTFEKIENERIKSLSKPFVSEVEAYENSERYKKIKKSANAQANGCIVVGLILVFILLKLMGAF